jgi:hypothetical protein
MILDATNHPFEGRGRHNKLQAIKQNFSSDPTIMIFIGARARVSAKALRNKGCSACLQFMQQAVH